MEAPTTTTKLLQALLQYLHQTTQVWYVAIILVFPALRLTTLRQNDVPDLYDQSLLTGDRRSVHAGSLPLQAPTDQMVPALSPTEVQAPLIMTAQIKSFELLCDPQNTVFVNQAPDGLPAAQEEIAPTLDKRQLILWGPARETIVKHFPTYSQHEIP